MSDLIRQIHAAQLEARELAALQGTNIAAASIRAGEQVVIANLRRIEAAESSDNVIQFPGRKP